MPVTPSDPILVVDDDQKITALVSLYLGREGYATLAAHDGAQALDLVRRQDVSLVVLDLMLPTVDGWTICRTLRETSDVPIVMLTARDDEADRIEGLSLGADDYVMKPFSPRELTARVKAVLRRSVADRPLRRPGKLVHGELMLDPARHKVTVSGRPIALTPAEFRLLHVLISEPGHAFGRAELLARLYPDGEAVVDRVIDVHVGKLRQKIEADPSNPRYVLTVWGIGYEVADVQ